MLITTYNVFKLAVKVAVSMICQVFKLFSVQKNRIVFLCYKHGSQYTDSTKSISEYLIQNYRDKYEIIWILDDPKKFLYLDSQGIKRIKFGSIKDLYYSNTCKVYITNMFGPYPYVIKRKDRIILETSHGVAYKNLLTGRFDKNRIDVFLWMQRSMKINGCDYALSGNSILTNSVYRKNIGYKGEIIEEGLPRNDMFFKDDNAIKDRVRKRYGITEEQNILLVMPTWKKDNNLRTIDIDYGKVMNLLKKKNGHDWVCLIRLHHLSNVDISMIVKSFNGKVIEATDYPDAQELLLTGDVLITDYSSVVWDFALQKKPIFIYAPDVMDYNTERGFNVPPKEWGLFKAENEEELYTMIEEHTLSEIAEASEAHLEKFGNCETGEATRLTCERIDRYCSATESNSKLVFIESPTRST